MKKIQAYTLMEVTIAMLLSAVTISICYMAYGLISQYYQRYQLKNERSDAVIGLRHVLERDFNNSRYILKSGSGIELEQDSNHIVYHFNEKLVLRELTGVHTDTFKLDYAPVRSYFEGREVLERDTIDRLEIDLLLGGKDVARLRIDKRYSAEDLFN
ncbi:hypothetical protein QWY86_15500 [Pedobacter aquatilis]|uniref:PulJ/GspJ family protein n=1 Tax=Pedobacter aquatilis TaxID=351343 RepID=UPI0025B4E1FE|nr:hypothetical protein [Pedobacter aquatilis]MDN3588088.1 hypothetical protein [Pedobacter aquatilis]